MKVPFLDLGRLHASIRGELDRVIGDVIESSAFIGGAVGDFEAEFAKAHRASGAAGCGSGTDALELSLRALGVGPGDEVVVPAMTFVATAEAAISVGATPVVADVDPTTLLLTPATVEAVRTSRTRAVLPVHLYGHVVPTEDLRSWVDDGLLVVEDAAQAHLAEFEGVPVGSVGHAACFSFFPGKNLGALGDGGAVIAREEPVLAEVRRVRDHGRTSKYVHDVPGVCSRLDGLQAAILRVKLRHLPEWTAARRRLADRYREHLPANALVPWSPGAAHHLLVARTGDREHMAQRLASAGVSTGVHYPVPLSQQPWLACDAAPAPAAEAAADEILSLPIDPLMSADEVDYVCDVFLSAKASAA